MKIALINLGCSKNLVDSEIMLGILSQAGYDVGLDDNNADIVIINTCSFIKDAEKESVQTIMGQICNSKKIIIVGCLAQKYGQELLELIPEVSAVVGTSDIGDIAEIVKIVTNKPECSYNRVSKDLSFVQSDNINRFHITVGPSSYIKIAEGCNCSCSYCIIPMLKGKYRSRKIESIVNEAKILSQNGINEIILIAQDTTCYGIDLYNKLSLVDLLSELEKIDGINWIRLMYTYPTYVTDELIDYIASSEKVLKYLDIPLQHASPRILKQMNRPNIDLDLFVSRLRTKIPEIILRTCFIVGFPGETEEEFKYLCNFVKDKKFDRLGVFEYSKVENTIAANFKGQILSKIKKQRRKKLMEIQYDISLEKHVAMIGKKIDVLLEKFSDSGKGLGRSYMDAPEIDGVVYVNSVEDYLPGDIIPVKITKASAYDLYGVVEN